MPSQYGVTRITTDVNDNNSPRKVMCDKCKVYTVPQGLQTRHADPTRAQEKFCPNCGHVHRAITGRDNH